VNPLEFHPSAQDEVDEAAALYEAQGAVVGADFRAELEAALVRIARDPFLYAVELGEFRACPLKGFPYTLFFIALEGRVWVAAMAHQSRRPGYWARRQPR
jgi:plasmid stabilization system protein ParE